MKSERDEFQSSEHFGTTSFLELLHFELRIRSKDTSDPRHLAASRPKAL